MSSYPSTDQTIDGKFSDLILTYIGKRIVRTKANIGRERKCLSWVLELGKEVMDEFRRFKKWEMKISGSTPILIAKNLITNSNGICVSCR